MALACGYGFHEELEGCYTDDVREVILDYIRRELPASFNLLCEKDCIYEFFLSCCNRKLIRDPETLRQLLSYMRTRRTFGEEKRQIERIAEREWQQFQACIPKESGRVKAFSQLWLPAERFFLEGWRHWFKRYEGIEIPVSGLRRLCACGFVLEGLPEEGVQLLFQGKCMMVLKPAPGAWQGRPNLYGMADLDATAITKGCCSMRGRWIACRRLRNWETWKSRRGATAVKQNGQCGYSAF